MALEIDGEMHVVEATAKSNYWPTNFVQRTTLKEWLQIAHAADYNVLHLPLSTAHRASFNVSRCLAWFEGGIEGLLYGYPTLLSGWVDTADQNLPSFIGGGTHNLVATAFALLDPLLMKYVYKPTETDASKFPSECTVAVSVAFLSSGAWQVCQMYGALLWRSEPGCQISNRQPLLQMLMHLRLVRTSV